MTHFKSEEWRQALLITQDLRAAMSLIDGQVEAWQLGLAGTADVVGEARRTKCRHLVYKLMRALEGLDGAPDTQPLWAVHAALWGLDRGDAGITPAIILGRLRDALGVLERVYWAGMCDAPPSREGWPATPLPPPPRLTVTISAEHCQAVLDGNAYPLTLDQATLLQALLDAGGDWVSAGKVVSKPERVIEKLPEALRAVVESARPKGTRIRL